MHRCCICLRMYPNVESLTRHCLNWHVLPLRVADELPPELVLYTMQHAVGTRRCETVRCATCGSHVCRCVVPPRPRTYPSIQRKPTTCSNCGTVCEDPIEKGAHIASGACRYVQPVDGLMPPCLQLPVIGARANLTMLSTQDLHCSHCLRVYGSENGLKSHLSVKDEDPSKCPEAPLVRHTIPLATMLQPASDSHTDICMWNVSCCL